MRVLVTGAYGFIGSHVTAQVLAAGHDVIGLGRRVDEAAERWPQVRWIAFDIAAATRPEDWQPHLIGIDAVVNCAGVLQDTPADSTRGVHVDGIVALLIACARNRVRRFVQISAIGVSADSNTAFGRTKHEADTAVMASDLEWVILRPSLVVGRAVYGGTALVRAVAAFPFVIPTIATEGNLQPVQVRDVAATAAFFLRPDASMHHVIDLVGPVPLSLGGIITLYRRWLGLSKAPAWHLPQWLALLTARMSDVVSFLGWRAPMRTTSLRQLSRGLSGDPAQWTKRTGIVPQALDAALAAEPATVQERWFSRLYLLKPLIFAVLALFWIVTGLLTLGPARDAATAQAARAGLGGLAAVAAMGGAVVDIMIGVMIAARRTAWAGLLASITLSAGYLLAAAALLPALWIDPLGPMVKVVPIIILALVALAILDDR